MKKVKVLSIVLAVVGILTLALGGTVLADDGDDAAPDTCQPGENPGQWGRYPGGFLGSCMDDIGELLGLSTEEIRALREDGLSLAEIAAGQGIGEDELVAAVVAGIGENLAEQVANGNITQERADTFLEQLPDRVATMITSSGPVFGRGCTDGDEDGFRQGFRQGFRRGFMAGKSSNSDAGFLPGMAGRPAH